MASSLVTEEQKTVENSDCECEQILWLVVMLYLCYVATYCENYLMIAEIVIVVMAGTQSAISLYFLFIKVVVKLLRRTTKTNKLPCRTALR